MTDGKRRDRPGRLTVDVGMALLREVKEAAEANGRYLKTQVIRLLREGLAREKGKT